MSMIALAVRLMLAEGVPHDKIVAAIAEMEAETIRIAQQSAFSAAAQIDQRSPGAKRTARWRATKRGETETVTERHAASQNVTERHAASQNVTERHAEAQELPPQNVPAPLKTPPEENPSKRDPIGSPKGSPESDPSDDAEALPDATMFGEIIPPTGRGRGPPRGKHALPDDWEPGARVIDLAREMGFSDDRFRHELAKFRDHARQNDRRCADWDAAARNWLRKAAEFVPGARPAQAGGNRGADDSRLAAMLRGAARVRNAHDVPG